MYLLGSILGLLARLSRDVDGVSAAVDGGVALA
jgi:hypothetical protein